MDSKLTMVDVNYLKWVGQRIIEFGVAKKRIAELEGYIDQHNAKVLEAFDTDPKATHLVVMK